MNYLLFNKFIHYKNKYICSKLTPLTLFQLKYKQACQTTIIIKNRQKNDLSF